MGISIPTQNWRKMRYLVRAYFIFSRGNRILTGLKRVWKCEKQLFFLLGCIYTYSDYEQALCTNKRVINLKLYNISESSNGVYKYIVQYLNMLVWKEKHTGILWYTLKLVEFSRVVYGILTMLTFNFLA